MPGALTPYSTNYRRRRGQTHRRNFDAMPQVPLAIWPNQESHHFPVLPSKIHGQQKLHIHCNLKLHFST